MRNNSSLRVLLLVSFLWSYISVSYGEAYTAAKARQDGFVFGKAREDGQYVSATQLSFLPPAPAEINAKDDNDNSQNIERVKKYLEKDKGKEALKILRTLPQNFDVLILTAQSYATLDDPVLAWTYYDCALKQAKNHEEREVAYFGIGKMVFWLDKYIRAKNIYRTLLDYPLNKQDHELALAGMVKSLAYADRTRSAYCLVPKKEKFTTPQMVVAASQASLWAGWPDLTKNILCGYKDIRCKIEPNSPLGKDLKDLQWQLNLATARNNITPAFYFYSDNEDFLRRTYLLEYSRYWSQCWQSGVGVKRLLYTQNSADVSADGLSVNQIWQPRRDLLFRGRLEPRDYSNNWNPFLWGAFADYIPNDIWHIYLAAQKEIVEAFPALNEHIADNMYYAGVKFSPFPYFQIDGSLNRLNFTDTNVREGYFLSAALLISAHIGLTVEARQREYTNDFKSPNYFSPERYKEDAVVLKLSRKMGDTWRYYVTLSRGRQTITSDAQTPPGSSPTDVAEAGINGPITHCIIFNAYYGWARQASAFQNSADYSYQYGAVSLNFLF